MAPARVMSGSSNKRSLSGARFPGDNGIELPTVRHVRQRFLPRRGTPKREVDNARADECDSKRS